MLTSDITIRMLEGADGPPKTVAGRIEWVMWLLNPVDDDGTPLAPFITKVQAAKLLDPVDDDGTPLAPFITKVQAAKLLEVPPC